MSTLPDWTTMPDRERDALLIKLAGEGLTNSQIADHFFGASRNSVIGRIHRIEQSLGKRIARNPPRQRNQTGQPKKSTASTPGAGRAASSSPKLPVERLPDNEPVLKTQLPKSIVAANVLNRIAQLRTEPQFDAPTGFRPIDGVTPIRLTQFNSTTCKWPVDGFHGREHLFCGAGCEPERNYCAAHRRLAYQPNSSMNAQRREKRA